MNSKNVIGPFVRRARTKKGWSQAELATKLQLGGWDLSRSGVGKIEAKLRTVNDVEFFHLLRVFKLTLEEFLSGS